MSFFTLAKHAVIVSSLSFAALLSGCQTTSGLSAAQVTMLENHGFQPTQDGWGLDLSGKILFGFADDEISADSQKYITELTQALLDVGLTHLRVDGHTDNTGDPAYNRILSQHRAKAVAQVISEAGMQEQNILTRGLGDSAPVRENSSREGRSENRRVSIVITSN